MNEPDILRAENWLHFKFYREQQRDDTWHSQLDWYHNVLRDLVRPWINSYEDIRFVFFGIYGPEIYEAENQGYEKCVGSLPTGRVSYIRLRAFIPRDRQTMNGALIADIKNHNHLFWDYEILKGYDVKDDLGNRFGRLRNRTIDNHRTILFIKYWDAACRYILEILSGPGDWDTNVDVWGIPHLVNNSLGSWLRVSDIEELKCPTCRTLMYIATWGIIPEQLRSQLNGMSRAPIFLSKCPQCSLTTLIPMNI